MCVFTCDCELFIQDCYGYLQLLRNIVLRAFLYLGTIMVLYRSIGGSVIKILATDLKVLIYTVYYLIYTLYWLKCYAGKNLTIA